MDGVAVVDKAAGWTSHDVVAKARGLLRERRIGHAGTLDPDATGLLLLGIGSATRLLRFLTEEPKTYTAEVVLGVETTTLDAAGEVTATHDMAGVTLDAARAAAATLTGPIEQVPPMVSAIKVGGRRLHELAREGIEVERAPRPVVVHRFDVQATDDPGVLRVEVTCSSGTYVRSLARDLGAALGGGAHLRALRRTASAGFTEADARPLEALEVRPVADAWRARPAVVVDEAIATLVGHGRVLTRDELGVEGDGPWGVFDGVGTLLAVYEPRGAMAKPALVLAPSSGGATPHAGR